MRIKTTIQKRFADVDILGHVNNVNLQHYFDVGKSDWFMKVLGVRDFWKEEGIITVATNTSYLAQTRLEDDIVVETDIEKIGKKSFELYQKIVGKEDGIVRAESRSVMVAFDFVRQESIAVPQQWREAMQS